MKQNNILGTKKWLILAISILVTSLFVSSYVITNTAEKNRFLGNWHIDASSYYPTSGYNYGVLTYLYFANDGTCILEGSSWEKNWLGWNEKGSDSMHGEWEFDCFTHKLTFSFADVKIICTYDFDGNYMLYLSDFHGPFSDGTTVLNAYYIKTD